MNASTTGMCVLQTTDEVDIGGHYNSTLEQGQCFVLTLLTLPQTAPERMSILEQPLAKARGGAHSRALATHLGRIASTKLPRDIPRARLAHHRGHGESEEERLGTRLDAVNRAKVVSGQESLGSKMVCQDLCSSNGPRLGIACWW